MFDFEVYIDAAAAALRDADSNPTSLQAMIDAENAAHSDFELPAILDERIVPFGEDPISPPFPVIEIAVPDFRIDDFSLAQLDGDLGSSLAVRAWLLDPTSFEQLTRTLYRFSRCIVNSLAQPDSFGDGVTIRELRGSFGLNPETNERQEIQASAMIVFTLDDTALRP